MNTWRNSCTRTSLKHKKLLLAGLLAALVCLSMLSVCIGAAKISPLAIVQDLLAANAQGTAYRIFLYIRLPRTLAAILAGSALATAGALLQSVLGNSLASPNTIGVNAGASIFVMALLAVAPTAYGLLPLAAFLGALLTAVLVYFLAIKAGASRTAVILAGVAVSSFCTACTNALTNLFPSLQTLRGDFMVGSFSGVGMERLGYAAVYILPALALAFLFRYDVSVLSLGSDTAASLGMRVRPMQGFFLLLAAVLAGGAVSFSGLVSFIGLIVPNALRLVAGSDERWLIPLCMVGGGVFALLCDILSRTLFVPYELPVGIILAFLGAPFFLWLLMKGKRGRIHG